MRFVYVDIFSYICNMENEEDFVEWVDIDSTVLLRWRERLINIDESYYGVFGIGDPVSAYHKIESVKRLGEIGVHVTFYNRNKIIHNYGK